MRVILILLALLCIMGLASAYLVGQYDPNQLYSNESVTGFLKDKNRNALPLAVFDMTGWGFMATEIYRLAAMQKDGNIGKRYAHYIDGQDVQWTPNLTAPANLPGDVTR